MDYRPYSLIAIPGGMKNAPTTFKQAQALFVRSSQIPPDRYSRPGNVPENRYPEPTRWSLVPYGPRKSEADQFFAINEVDSWTAQAEQDAREAWEGVEEDSLEALEAVEEGFMDFECGITTIKNGPAVIEGRLRVYSSRDAQVFCFCGMNNCNPEVPIGPCEFERHGRLLKSRKWKQSVWVRINGRQVAIASLQKGESSRGDWLLEHLPRRK